nr:PREDICTED: sodium-coupled monocarboxylate transporter 1-like [Tribolium castaneum]|eukprot:XP_015836814.1 PREDICTED: sodium-coupled monocarboxylate transporter 1-like [Tribolium castaneum]
MEATVLTLLWYDYLIFILILIFSLLIGIYFGYFAKSKQSNPSQYLQGTRKMGAFPVAISLIAGNCSPMVVLGFCSEVYNFGAYILLCAFSYILAFFANRFIYLPVLYNLEISTSYEYLEKRFDRRCRRLVSAIFITGCFFFISMTMYAPALALSAVTGFKLHYITIFVSSICIIYTTIGGFKTVVWTDVLQFIVVATTLVIILGLGIQSKDGLGEIWQKAWNTEILDIFQFDPNPTIQDSFWVMIIGFTVNLIGLTCVDQIYVQKMRSLRTFKEASKAFVCFLLGNFLVIVIYVMLGLTMYARYANCDPFRAGLIASPDQLLPYFVLDVGKIVPGVPGIFVASIFSSSLSVQSAMLNSVAASLYSDILSKFLGNISERKAGNILKLTVLGVGTACTLLVFVIHQTGTIFGFILILLGITCGPVLGLFSAGLIFPKINATGAFYGTVLALCVGLSIACPATYYRMNNMIKRPIKPLSTSGCFVFNQTAPASSWLNETMNSPAASYQPPFIFRISYFYFSTICVGITIISALVISYVTNKNDPVVQRELISPISRFLLDKKENERHKSVKYSNVDKILVSSRE